MIITHKLKKSKISREINNTIDRKNSLFLLNKKGQYLSLPADFRDEISNYNGWVCPTLFDLNTNSYSMYKIIDSINTEKISSEVINNFETVQRRSKSSVESFALMNNGLYYSVSSYSGKIFLDLDFRELYDYSDQGRIYSVAKIDEMNDCIIVSYTKYSDNSLNNVMHKRHLVIKGVEDFAFVDTWIKKDYFYDKSRGTKSEFYVYRPCSITCKKNLDLFFFFGEDKDELIRIVKSFNSQEYIETLEKRNLRYESNVLSYKNGLSKEIDLETSFAYTNCVHALDSLSSNFILGNNQYIGLWAGLPWFHQFWARDELISIHSVFLEHRYDYSKKVLLKYLDGILHDGRLINRLPAKDLSLELGNADGIGWMFKRFSDFLVLCEKRDSFDMYFTLKEMHDIREKLKYSIEQLMNSHSNNGLITNKNLETWMDTYFSSNGYSADFRSGARIEIQALYLSMLKFMRMLNTYLSNKLVKRGDKLISNVEDSYSELEKNYRSLVREKFLVEKNGKKILNDGYDCELHDVVRPNIFLAYYIYPELLEPSEWEDTFDDALFKLWCETIVDGKILGGLSTIDKSHYLYQNNHTGMNNLSYHRGDTWFFVNNLAAISMYRLNKHKYSSYIERILILAVNDILFNGYIGYASEIASSSTFSSAGCFCQTWSIATFIELIHEMYIE